MKWKRISATGFVGVLACWGAMSQASPLLSRVQGAGFHCVAKSNGHVCTAHASSAQGFTYPQPIAVLIPSGVQNPAKVIVYLHGFRGVCPAANASLESLESEWQLLRQMIAGGAADSVMLFPASQGNCATYDRALVPRFGEFVEWGQSLLQPRDPSLVLAGHSGAGTRMANALAAHPSVGKKVGFVFLLDATYGMGSAGSVTLKKWGDVARQNAEMRIFTRYVAGTSTEAGSRNLKTLLPSQVDSAVSASASHCRVPSMEIQTLLRRRMKTALELQFVSF